VVIIESDIGYDYFPRQTTSDESYDHNPFQATFDESYDHNPIHVTSDDTSDDTLKSSSDDTCSSDCTWEQKKFLKNRGLDLPKRKKTFEGKQGTRSSKAKATIPSEFAQWYDDFSSDEARTVYKGKRGSSFRNAAIIKQKKPKSRSKHLAPTTPRTWSTCTNVVVQSTYKFHFGPYSCYNLASNSE
nr:hypothetical protein [Tanacetum cinerariifolium]